MTREEIRTLARKKLGETTAAFWTDDEINEYTNLGCKDVAYRTKCLRTNATFSSVSCVATTAGSNASSNEYTLSTSVSTGLLSIIRADFMQDGTDWVNLRSTTREELDDLHPGWRTLMGYTYVTGGTTTYNYSSEPATPTDYYWNKEEDIFGLYPPPDDENEGTYIKVWYAQDHTNIAADASSPAIPKTLHLAIVEFVVATGFETRGWGDRSNDYWNKYFGRVNDYLTHRKSEREDDELIMKNYRNI